MPGTLDHTDIPRVAPAELARAMRFMIDNGKGLVLLRGVNGADMRELEEAIWNQLDGDIAERRAVLVRFQCLVEVFSAQRLRELMLRRGFRLIAPALHVAAGMRLSTKWGFSPHKFNMALQVLIAQLEQQSRVAVSEDRLELAA
jgi:hypothetical protein